jgi:hypothetical protein
MCSCAAPQCASSKRSFKRVAIGDSQNPNDNPSGSFFVLLDSELAVLEGKLVGNILVKHEREDLFKETSIWMTFHVLTTVYEDIVLPRVSVHITV